MGGAGAVRHRPFSRAQQHAIERLRELLLCAARFELARRRRAFAESRPGELDDLATPAAADALIAILRKLHTYRGDSRFTTWAYKFALLEAAVRVRRRAWQDAKSRSTKTAGHSLPTAAPYPKPTPKRPS